MPQFWKVRNIPFWEGMVLQNSPQKLGEFPLHSFSHLTWFEVPTYARGLQYHLPFRGHLRLTNYNFHAHEQYWIPIHYHSCSTDIYRWVPLKPDFLGAWKSVRLKHYPAYPIIIISLNIQRNLATKIWAKQESGLTAVRLKRDPPVQKCGRSKMPQFWKVRNILFWEGFLQNSSQKLGVSSTLLLPPEMIWGSPYARGLWYHLPFRGLIRLTNYNFHAHVQYCITIHFCSIDKYRNMEGPKCHNFGRLGISCFEKEGFIQDHHTPPKQKLLKFSSFKITTPSQSINC